MPRTPAQRWAKDVQRCQGVCLAHVGRAAKLGTELCSPRPYSRAFVSRYHPSSQSHPSLSPSPHPSPSREPSVLFCRRHSSPSRLFVPSNTDFRIHTEQLQSPSAGLSSATAAHQSVRAMTNLITKQAHPAFPFRAIPCSWCFTVPTGRKCFLMPSCCNLNLLVLVVAGQLNISAANCSSSQRTPCSRIPAGLHPH